MDKDFLKEVASQLRKPNGDFGREVADKMNENNQLMNLKTIELLEVQNNESILEVGMANGAYASLIVNKASGVHYTGLDYSSDMVDLAKKKNQELVNSGLADFIVGDINKLPFQPNSIEKIFTVNTVYFWDDIHNAFSECHRVLKTDGLFAIAIRPAACLQKYPSTQFDFNHYEIEEIVELLSNHSFEIYKTIHEFEPETEVLDEMINPEFAVIVGKKIKQLINHY